MPSSFLNLVEAWSVHDNFTISDLVDDVLVGLVAEDTYYSIAKGVFFAGCKWSVSH
jgi:hypothetical protein